MRKKFEPVHISPQQLRRLIEQHFEVIPERSGGDEMMIICPEPGCPDRTGNRSINLKHGITNCWRCRGANGHIVPFLRKHQVEFDAESIDDILSSSGDAMAELEEALNDSAPAPGSFEVTLPEGFTLLKDDPDCIRARLIGQMAQRKHLYFEDFIEAGVGFTRKGDWEPFAIFPVYEVGKLVYYQGRTYSTMFEGKVTKKFPSKKDVPHGAGNWLYGYDNIVMPGVECLIVVESILNVLSLRWELKCQGIQGVEPVAVFKHRISPPQMKKLLASQAKEICIMYDGDATNDAWEECKKISGHRLATVAVMPVGTDANDNANLALERFRERRSFTPENALYDSLGV